jgi:putative DNA primase/helicase
MIPPHVNDLWSRGFSVVPIRSGGKQPAVSWKEYQSRRPTRDELEDWFGGAWDYNVGIVTGEVSGIVAVDCDSADAVAWADEHLPSTAMVTRTAKGEHRFYRHPGFSIKNRARVCTGEARVAIDVRGDGGYVVGPGSVHETGVRYERTGDWPAIDDLPVFDPTWLDVAGARTRNPMTTRGSRSGDGASPTSSVVRQGERNDTLFREGCRLRERGMDREAINVALLAINQDRCTPPLDTSEVERIASSCASYAVGGDTFPTTEAGDAEFFAQCYRDCVRYDHRLGDWQVFQNHHWGVSPDGAIERLALKAMRQRQAAALEITDSDRRNRLGKWALAGECRRRLANMRVLARSVPPIADTGENWDADPWSLGVPNGVVELRTGTLRDGRPEDRITMQTGTPFDRNALCPIWDQTVAEIFGNDDALIAYFDRFVGYSLTGDCREEVLALTHGEGANGKSTLINTLGEILGDYTDDLPFSALELHVRTGISNDIAKIVGKRFVTSSESGETRRLNEARVKALTGRDPMTARFLHREFFTFRPVAKFWLATNHKPVVRDTSVGFWRRIHLIPFTRSFTHNPDLTLKDKLRAEAPGILARAVRGCLAWQREGLNPPEVVLGATATYRTDSMPLARFLEARCVVQKGGRPRLEPCGRRTSVGATTSTSRHDSLGHSFVRRSMSSSRRIRAIRAG